MESIGEWDLETVEAAVTILVDNTVMELIPGSEIIERISKPNKNFIAEHGFAALIETGGKRILVDTGATGIALEHNLGLIGLSVDDIDVTFLSHGHSDHTGGIQRVRGRIMAHPDTFNKRYIESKGGVIFDLSSPEIDLESRNIELHREPLKLAGGVMTTGEIPRLHEWEELKVFRIQRNGKMLNDRVLDDQGVIINTNKGLVIIAGCSHAGIVNTIEHAIEITGITTVYCVIGGFHLIGPGEDKIDRTIEEFRRLKIGKLIPLHCTGFEAIKRISIAFPVEFEYATTGCRMEF
ncbi:metallo-beta-lactamase superfamily protein [bacterium BMS3Bbin06]|nr:metallo-beta-lactamase superfamily protein [bacterium BMS3Abin08]GBE35655.1 metallo-beta-lactamase superfamily protein [bacterium BMS3Bbin06]